MKQQLAIVIAALMITSMAFAISTTVSATHERTASIDDDSVQGGVAMIRTITIANDGPDAINTVWIIVPEDWNAEAVKQVPKDNIVWAADDNLVVLPAGTVVELLGNVIVTLAENTEVIVVKGKWIFVNEAGENTRLNENAVVEVREQTATEEILTSYLTSETVALEQGDDGVATWSTTENYTGDYSVKLSILALTDYAELSVPVDIALEDLDLGSTSFWFNMGGGDQTPYLILELETDNRINTDSDKPTASYTGYELGDWAEYGAENIGDGTTPREWQWDGDGWHSWDDTLTQYGATTKITSVIICLSDFPGLITTHVDDLTVDGETCWEDPATPEIEVTGEVEVNLNTDNRLRLLTDTVVLVSDGIATLPENTMLELVAANEDEIAQYENVETTQEITVTLTDNKARMVTDKPSNLLGYDIPTGEKIELTDNEVVIPASTVVQLDADADIRIPENTDVIRENDKQLDISEATVENSPINWTRDSSTSTLPPGTCLEWAGIGENQIASGESLEFPFAFMSPAGGEYTIYVRTKDTKGVVKQTTITLTVDDISPTVEIAVSPDLAKANTKVTITVTASEPLAKLDNVMVAEKDAPENTQVTMNPNADKTVWKGTYTTGDNKDRDGTATVYVFGYEDLIGNEGVIAENTFTVDRMKPPTPKLTEITGFPTDNIPEIPGVQTNTATWFIEGNAKDNRLNVVDNTENMTVKIRVGTATYDVTSGADGYFHQSITLTEGTQEVGIQYIDRAGNMGEENAENITLDTIGPSIEPGKIAGKALTDGVRINNNTPKITLTISDAGLGVDNIPFNADENEGYSVQLWNADEKWLENLVNALAHDNNTLEFENTLSELDDNTYYIYVEAGDNLQMDNALVKFVIDTAPPSAPTVGDAYKIVSTMDSPVVVKDASRTIAGTAEPGADITVYGTVNTTEKVLGTATAGSDGKWTVTFTLTAGSNTKIELSATDEAGNEGFRESYGWMLADASAPSVTLAEVPDTTDKTSITISGTVTKDAWEDWSEITLTVQVGTGKVTVPCVGGSYEYSVALSEGPNTIVVQATDDIGNTSVAEHAVVERVVTPWATYAIILVIIALVLAAIAIFRKR